MEKEKVFDMLNKLLVCKYISQLAKSKKRLIELYPTISRTSSPDINSVRMFVLLDDISSFVESETAGRLN